MQSLSIPDLDVVLVALRHLQTSLNNGVQLEYLADIADLSQIDPDDIDRLCESLNFGALEPEAYQTIAVSTAHITEEDSDLLKSISTDGKDRDNYVMSREYGYFIKLTDDIEQFISKYSFSDALNKLLRWSFHSGYQMLELDCDAGIRSEFQTFDW